MGIKLAVPRFYVIRSHRRTIMELCILYWKHRGSLVARENQQGKRLGIEQDYTSQALRSASSHEGKGITGDE